VGRPQETVKKNPQGKKKKGQEDIRFHLDGKPTGPDTACLSGMKEHLSLKREEKFCRSSRQVPRKRGRTAPITGK